jgi:hypothetical protein
MSARQLMASALLAFAAASTPAVAQQTTTLRGPWLGAGISTASASVNCDICVDDRNGGLSGYLAGGGCGRAGDRQQPELRGRGRTRAELIPRA